MEIPAGTKSILVSFPGYESRIIQINEDKTNYTVRLVPEVSDKNKIQEVIITGYQKIEKRKQTSAVATVKMDNISQAGVASVDQMLSGQIAGVVVTPETDLRRTCKDQNPWNSVFIRATGSAMGN